jgi:glutathione S-transferase
MLKIYGKRHSRAARCLWVLEEMGLPYTQVPLDTQRGDTHTREYMTLNPAGKVPTIDDDGFVLRESLAINAYLVGKADTRIWPDDVQSRAYINQWSSWATTEMEIPLNAIFHAKRRAAAKGAGVDPAFITDNILAAGKALQLLEDHLVAHRYVACEAFTLGDINAFTAVMLVPMFRDLSDCPAVQEWMMRCSARPAWRRVTALP